MSVILGPGDLLEYNPEYRLLICRQCSYAIQKNAIDGHLLKHKIYRGARQALIDEISGLDIAEPTEVTPPSGGSLPVHGIPVLSGYKCTEHGCGHLTASSKRMQRHWSEGHSLGHQHVPALSAIAHIVHIQTFFRGNHVKYFEVSGPAPSAEVADVHVQRIPAAEKPSLSDATASVPPQPSIGPILRTLDLNLLRLLHHFHIRTVATLPTIAASSTIAERTLYWTEELLPAALQGPRKASGILALAALHLLTFSNEDTDYPAQLQSASELAAQAASDISSSSTCLQPSDMLPSGRDHEHIRLLISCAQWTQGALFDNISTADTDPLGTLMFLLNRSSPRSPSARPLVNAELDADARRLFSISIKQSSSESRLQRQLRVLPLRILDLGRQPNAADSVVAILTALISLIELVGVAFAPRLGLIVWHCCHDWVLGLSQDFYTALDGNDPGALLVLHHWAATLLKGAEQQGCWFIHGASMRVESAILDRLDSIDGLGARGHEVVVSVIAELRACLA